MKMNKYEEKAKEIIDEKEDADLLLLFAIISSFLITSVVKIFGNINDSKAIVFFIFIFIGNRIFFYFFSPYSLLLKNNKEYQIARKIMKDYDRKCKNEKKELKKIRRKEEETKNEERYKELKEYVDKLKN